MTSLGEVAYFTICDDECGSVVLSALGAGVVALSVPDGNGVYRDVVIGYPSAEAYCHDDPNAGKFIGRYANRIARGVFSIDGNEYHLECNCGPNALHGGREGFAHRIWKSRTVGDNAVEFSLTSDDGDQGYPGTLTVKALYTWMPSCGLCLDIVATTDRPTVLNLTNHCYFNLDGHNSGSVLSHKLQLNASRYLVTDSSLAPTGELAEVKGTPMDFIQQKTLGRMCSSTSFCTYFIFSFSRRRAGATSMPTSNRLPTAKATTIAGLLTDGCRENCRRWQDWNRRWFADVSSRWSQRCRLCRSTPEIGLRAQVRKARTVQPTRITMLWQLSVRGFPTRQIILDSRRNG